MNYEVMLVNADGSKTWLQELSSLSASFSYISSQGSGTYSIEYGNQAQSSILQQVVQ